MRTRMRVAAAIFAGIIAAGGGGAALASSGTPAATHATSGTKAAAAKTPRYVVLNCSCTPDCADGHFHYYPSLEVLWGSAKVKGHPAERRYTKLTVIFTGKKRPPVYVLKNGKPVATYPLTQTFDAM
jgi:hypothetical protein